MKVLIDKNAGVCPGVERAIKQIEQSLGTGHNIVSLGPVLHNDRELQRLSFLGLKQAEGMEPEDLSAKKDSTFFIRTHGIPKEVQAKMDSLEVRYIDGTCSIVKRVQKLAERHYREGFQVIITGKPNHPEAIGINGYCSNKAVIVQDIEDFTGKKLGEKVLLISQTTFPQQKFIEIAEYLKKQIESLKIVDTTCKHINRRDRELAEFARSVDVVIMVGGRSSSNTGVLYNVCKAVNPNSYRIESEEELDPAWIKGCKKIGITGSASTPRWQLEKVKEFTSPTKGK